eukprot:1374636-Rhodomonas_salina.2
MYVTEVTRDGIMKVTADGSVEKQRGGADWGSGGLAGPLNKGCLANAPFWFSSSINGAELPELRVTTQN